MFKKTVYHNLEGNQFFFNEELYSKLISSNYTDWNVSSVDS